MNKEDRYPISSVVRFKDPIGVTTKGEPPAGHEASGFVKLISVIAEMPTMDT